MAKEQKSAQEVAAANAAAKLEAFKRIGNKRLPKALKSLDNMIALANQRSYSWDAKQQAKIFSLIDAKVTALKNAFTNPGKTVASADTEL